MDKYVGKRLDGRYEINELLGCGGMSRVYSAYDIIDDRTVAIKILKDEFLNNRDFIRRFKNESKAIAVISHPNVVKVSDVSFGDLIQYIVMEYVEGVTLTDFLATCPSFSVRKRLLSEILEAVEYLHKKGLLHNDLKTDNIIVSTIGNHIRIIDFGYSETDAQYMTKRLGGTPEASAPEVLAGNTDIPSTSSSDIYSLGGIIAAVFPNRYAWIVKKCRRIEPLDRYQDVDTLRRAIEFVEGLRKGLLIVTVLILASYIVMTLFVTQRKIYEEKYQSQLQHLETTVVRLQKDSAEIVKIERDIERELDNIIDMFEQSGNVTDIVSNILNYIVNLGKNLLEYKYDFPEYRVFKEET